MSIDFLDLKVYKCASELAMQISKVADAIPRSAPFEVTDQLIRASQSVMANIAEGYGRKKYKRDFARFLTFAMSSCDEVRSHLVFIRLNGWIDERQYDDLFRQTKNCSVRLANFLKIIRSELS
jgi:four helix bundle protein